MSADSSGEINTFAHVQTAGVGSAELAGLVAAGRQVGRLEVIGWLVEEAAKESPAGWSGVVERLMRRVMDDRSRPGTGAGWETVRQLAEAFLRINGTLPTKRALAREFGVSPNTLAKAVDASDELTRFYTRERAAIRRGASAVDVAVDAGVAAWAVQFDADAEREKADEETRRLVAELEQHREDERRRSPRVRYPDVG